MFFFVFLVFFGVSGDGVFLVFVCFFFSVYLVFLVFFGACLVFFFGVFLVFLLFFCAFSSVFWRLLGVFSVFGFARFFTVVVFALFKNGHPTNYFPMGSSFRPKTNNNV